MSLLLQANGAPRCAASEPSPNWQPLRPPAGAETPLGDIIGCSGHTPVSMTPTVTFEPAFAAPPSCCHTLVAPRNCVLSSSGCWSESCCTATTPGVARTSETSFAGTCAATPP